MSLSTLRGHHYTAWHVRRMSIVCVVVGIVGIAQQLFIRSRYSAIAPNIFLMGFSSLAVIGCFGSMIGKVLEKIEVRLDKLEKQ